MTGGLSTGDLWLTSVYAAKAQPASNMSCDCVAPLPPSIHATCHKYLQPDCYYNSTQTANGRRQTASCAQAVRANCKLHIAFKRTCNLQHSTCNLIKYNRLSLYQCATCLCVCGGGAAGEESCSEVKTLIKLTWQTTWWGNFMRKRNVANVNGAIQKDQRSLWTELNWTGHTQSSWLKAFWPKTHKNNNNNNEGSKCSCSR